MSNTIKTLSDGDITRKALSILHNNLVFVKTINREYDDRFARSGAKNGGTLLIREPNQFTVRTGAIMDTQDVTEATQTLTLATQLGVDINFSSVELTLSLDEFADRILKPAMTRLAAEVDKTVINGCYVGVANFENTTFGTAPVLADILTARSRIAKGLAPTSDRHFLGDSLAINSILAASSGLHNPISDIAKQYETGLMGDLYGFKFWETEMAPTHTTGSRTDATPTVITTASSASFTSDSAQIIMTAFTSSTTFAAGDVFTIAGVYDVNPETKVAYAHLKQWAVLTAVTATSTLMTCNVTPTPVTSGAKQNCVISTSSSTAAVVCATAAGGSGVASTGYVNSLAYHKNAFTWVSADLEMPRGVDFAAREVYDGISLRVVRQYDVVNDKFPCRIDVLFGYKTVRPGWACRVCS